MYRKVLVPLDGSRRAEAILPHVEQLAKRYQAGVLFMQVVQSHKIIMDHSNGYTAEIQRVATEQDTHEAETYLFSLVGDFREKRIDAEKIITHGPVVDSIIAVANQEHADIIAIASHGRTGLTRVFYGSVAASLLQRVDRPLLLIRSRYYDQT